MNKIFKKIGYGLAVLALVLSMGGTQAFAAFSYYRAITVDHTKVPNTDQTDFPIGIRTPVSVVSTVGTAVTWVSGDTFPSYLAGNTVNINGTVYTVASVTTSIALVLTGSAGTQSSVAFNGAPYLATVANGGLVQNASGYDIGFYTNSDCSTGKMKWETTNWSATTGASEYWVKYSSLLTASDSVFYQCYGDSGISTDQSDSANTWNSAFKGVWHLKDGTTLSLSDSTTNALTLTQVNSPTALTAQFDGGANLSTTGRLNVTNTILDSTTYTYEGWLNVNGDTAGYLFERGPGGSTVNAYLWYQAGTNRWVFGFNNGTSYIDHFYYASLLSGWNHYAYMMNDAGDSIILYINGVAVQSDAETTSPSTSGTQVFNIGTDRFAGGHFDGYVDEIRISNTARSADWIKTGYNNQSSPFTFYSVGNQTAGGASTLIKTWNAIADAVVKTWNGITRASIKSRNGLQ